MKTSRAVDRTYDFPVVDVPARGVSTVLVVTDHIFRGEQIKVWDENRKVSFDINLTVAGQDMFSFMHERDGAVYREQNGRVMMPGDAFAPSGLG